MEVAMMNRKLIKPNLRDIKQKSLKDTKRKPPPPYKTNAENYYYIKQMNNHVPLIFELINGETIKGRIEWYDEKCLKIRRPDGDNIILYKTHLKYLFKDPAFIEEHPEKTEKPLGEGHDD
jgi:hypothetical protein